MPPVFPVLAALVLLLAALPSVAQTAPAPQASPARKLFASPLVTLERLGGRQQAPLTAPGAAGGLATQDGQPPLFLLPPSGFTSFPEVVPPNGGGLVTQVE
jgi:hypothetical protein